MGDGITDDTIRTWDSYGDAYSAAMDWGEEFMRTANRFYSDEMWTDLDADEVAAFIEQHADDVALVELYGGRETDTPLIHYFDTSVGEMRMFDPRIAENIDDTDDWIQHAFKYNSRSYFCLVEREAAFDYAGHDDPNDYEYFRGEGITLEIEASDEPFKVEDFDVEKADDAELSGTMNNFYEATTPEYQFEGTFEVTGEERENLLGMLGSEGYKYETPADVLRDTADTVEDKHGDYGHAIEKVAAIKGVLAVEGEPEVVELDDGREAVVMGEHTEETAEERRMGGIITRLLDKVCRGYTLTFQSRTDNVGEKLRETWSDAAGYCGHAATSGEDN